MNSWLLPDTATAMADFVSGCLVDPQKNAPFNIFMEAMKWVDSNAKTILDVGCGVGHYGAICREYYPKLRYTGTDFSQSMIDKARSLYDLEFECCSFEDNHFGDYDIVLIAQVMEGLEDSWSALELVLKETRGWLILHRLRTTNKPSFSDTTLGYGHQVKNFVWNMDDVLSLVGKRLAKEIEWVGVPTATLVLGMA